MYGKATFWFGALLSLAEECDRKQLLDDATVSEKIELFKIVTQGLAAITGFYSQ